MRKLTDRPPIILPENATLADIVGGLSKPEHYVRSALANMYVAEKEYGPLVIRIGRMGTGQVPHYRFDQVTERELLEEMVASLLPMASFNGRNHKPLVAEGEESEILRNEHWSRGRMTLGELAALLGAIRSKGRGR